MDFYIVNLIKYIDCRMTNYRDNKLVIIASSPEEAEQKLKRCLENLFYNDGDITVQFKPSEEIRRCDGLMITEGFEGSTYCCGV